MIEYIHEQECSTVAAESNFGIGKLERKTITCYLLFVVQLSQFEFILVFVFVFAICNQRM